MPLQLETLKSNRNAEREITVWFLLGPSLAEREASSTVWLSCHPHPPIRHPQPAVLHSQTVTLRLSLALHHQQTHNMFTHHHHHLLSSPFYLPYTNHRHRRPFSFAVSSLPLAFHTLSVPPLSLHRSIPEADGCSFTVELPQEAPTVHGHK